MSAATPADRLREAAVVRAASEALEPVPDSAWLVGGGVRNAHLDRSVTDLDLIVDGDPGAAAKRLAASSGGHSFPLSEEFSTWRVIAADRSWQADLVALRGDSINADLALRDFTVNAIAVPLGDLAATVDPSCGLADLEAGVLRAVSDRTFVDDPARLMRLPRLTCDLAFAIEPATTDLAKRDARLAERAAGERIFAELRALLSSASPVAGLKVMDELGVTEVLLPELRRLQGVEQNPYHHLDVYGHTLEVLRQLVDLAPGYSVFGDRAAAVAGALDLPLADELTRGQALRFAALFHDIAKPETRQADGEGRVRFMGHDRLGANTIGEIFARLRTSRKLTGYVQALTLHHLRLGFLLRDLPLSRRTIFRYITACEPVALEVTVLSVADRLATRGPKTRDAIVAAHLELAAQMAADVLEWRAEGPPEPLIRGDELAAELGIEQGPQIAALLRGIAEARYAGEVQSRSAAIDCARRLQAAGE